MRPPGLLAARLHATLQGLAAPPHCWGQLPEPAVLLQ